MLIKKLVAFTKYTTSTIIPLKRELYMSYRVDVKFDETTNKKILPDKLNIRLYDTFGCTIVATAVIQNLKNLLPNCCLCVYTKNPDLIFGLSEADCIYDLNVQSLNSYDIDLAHYLEYKKPQESKPFRHLYQHMLEVISEQTGLEMEMLRKNSFLPKINLEQNELDEGREIVKNISQNKPLIWIQTKTSSYKKDWYVKGWLEVRRILKNDFAIVDLSVAGYTKRQSIAITKFCFAGITLDTFLIHGSKAIGAKNVVALLISSHPEVVTYSDQIVLNGLEKNITPRLVSDAILSAKNI